jgi:DNA-binding transcriptional LysR family regulator
MLAEFCGAYPAVVVELREESTEEMVADLYAGRIDAATLAALPRSDDGRLAFHSLGEEPLVLIAGTMTPLADKARMPIAAMAGFDLVLYRPGSAVREVILSALAVEGVTPRVRLETRDYRTARALASVGMAAAIVPRSVAEEPGPPVCTLRLEPELTWTPSLAWAAAHRPGPALAAFIDFAIRHPELSSVGR